MRGRLMWAKYCVWLLSTVQFLCERLARSWDIHWLSVAVNCFECNVYMSFVASSYSGLVHSFAWCFCYSLAICYPEAMVHFKHHHLNITKTNIIYHSCRIFLLPYPTRVYTTRAIKLLFDCFLFVVLWSKWYGLCFCHSLRKLLAHCKKTPILGEHNAWDHRVWCCWLRRWYWRWWRRRRRCWCENDSMNNWMNEGNWMNEWMNSSKIECVLPSRI